MPGTSSGLNFPFARAGIDPPTISDPINTGPTPAISGRSVVESCKLGAMSNLP